MAVVGTEMGAEDNVGVKRSWFGVLNLFVESTKTLSLLAKEEKNSNLAAILTVEIPVPKWSGQGVQGVPDIVKQSLEASTGCLDRTIPGQKCMVILIDLTNDSI